MLYVLLWLIRWIAIYSLDSIIHPFLQLGPGHKYSETQNEFHKSESVIVFDSSCFNFYYSDLLLTIIMNNLNLNDSEIPKSMGYGNQCYDLWWRFKVPESLYVFINSSPVLV